jgi:hypothetical protein
MTKCPRGDMTFIHLHLKQKYDTDKQTRQMLNETMIYLFQSYIFHCCMDDCCFRPGLHWWGFITPQTQERSLELEVCSPMHDQFHCSRKKIFSRQENTRKVWLHMRKTTNCVAYAYKRNRNLLSLLLALPFVKFPCFPHSKICMFDGLSKVIHWMISISNEHFLWVPIFHKKCPFRHMPKYIYGQRSYSSVIYIWMHYVHRSSVGYFTWFHIILILIYDNNTYK